MEFHTVQGATMTKPRLIDQTRNVLRLFHYSIRTEEAYIQWIKRFILFHKKRHPKDMGEKEIRIFLTHLAVDKHVSASTKLKSLKLKFDLKNKSWQIELTVTCVEFTLGFKYIVDKPVPAT